MRGRKHNPKRKINFDPKYNREDLAKFINYIMRKGKKTLAQKIFYASLDLIKEKTKKDPLDIFDQAIKNVSPSVELRSRRVGGANYQVPVRVESRRTFTLASRWIIEAARVRKGKPMNECLAQELLEAASNQGAAIKKKNDVYRMAEANRAFAHFVR